MMRSYAVTAFVAAVGAGCSQQSSPTGPSSQGLATMPAPSAVQHAVPFKGSLEGSQTLTPLQPPLGFVNGSATGNGTHLGLFTVTFPHTVNFATRSGTGTYTFTAANGDTLTADFSGQASGGPVVSIVENATVTGGTGRFEGATGSFVVERWFDQASGVTEGRFEGTISATP